MEFLLSHEEQLNKPEENLSTETKECPMCAETIKAKKLLSVDSVATNSSLKLIVKM